MVWKTRLLKHDRGEILLIGVAYGSVDETILFRPALGKPVLHPAAGRPHSFVSSYSNSFRTLFLPLEPPRAPVYNDILFESRSRRMPGRALGNDGLERGGGVAEGGSA